MLGRVINEEFRSGSRSFGLLAASTGNLVDRMLPRIEALEGT